MLWKELDEKIFSLPMKEQVAIIQKNKAWIIERLNRDSMKVSKAFGNLMTTVTAVPNYHIDWYPPPPSFFCLTHKFALLQLYFGKKADGSVADLDQMTYSEVVCRMIELMYVAKRSKWIDVTYRIAVFDMLTRAVERLARTKKIEVCLQTTARITAASHLLPRHRHHSRLTGSPHAGH